MIYTVYLGARRYRSWTELWHRLILWGVLAVLAARSDDFGWGWPLMLLWVCVAFELGAVLEHQLWLRRNA